MDKKIAMQWVKALRSGKYKQGKERLKSADGSLCCLGVLQEAVLKIPIKPGEEVLSERVAKAAGIRSCDGYGYREAIPYGRKSLRDLAEANDCGKRFPAIANWIEKHWEML